MAGLAGWRTEGDKKPRVDDFGVITEERYERCEVRVRGIVQGVGFRPFIYRLATKYNLKGWVSNTSEDVRIEIGGASDAVRAFLEEMQASAPPRATIENITVRRLGVDAGGENRGFEIRQSVSEPDKYQLISPDIATCPDCLREIFTPGDRRYRYPFTNCTNCGPRFTIIEDIPYDRVHTTMKDFQMCPACQREYDDPLDRRFHAQPDACPVCGPGLELLNAEGITIPVKDAIDEAARLLIEGRIVAIKGLGGFLLACDATNRNSVDVLRKRKLRPSKPFAVMVASLEEARRYCHVGDAEAKLLKSPAGPIVLLRWKGGTEVDTAVAPGLKFLGVMLPYTPLHHLLLDRVNRPLVMTSGNLSEEPIAKDNDEALERLSGIADYFLVHNRNIYARYDDSVTFVERDMPQIIRRARGYAPYPVRLGFRSRQVLACGAGEKNTFCLTRDEYAFISQHIGDMENIETLDYYKKTVDLYKKLFRIEPEIVAYDLHPDYLSTRYASEVAEISGIKQAPVQHHFAHIVSGMVDNGIETPVIGVAFDGTGYGNDGHIWGGEFIVADYRNFTRVGHIEYLPLPGGAQAIKKPYRIATAYILRLLGKGFLKNLPFSGVMSDTEADIIQRQLESGLNSPLTSSCGRLFDAVSALTGVRHEISYEGQAAIELEMRAYDELQETKRYPFSVVERSGTRQICIGDMLGGIIDDIKHGLGQSHISARFHNTVAQMIMELCRSIAAETGIKEVVLSGGVFQNRILIKKATGLLEGAGFTVYLHRQVPANDGGVSLGQAVIANFMS